MECYVNFGKDSLLKSQIWACRYIFRDMVACFVMINIAMLIVCVALMMFFNIYIALLIESLVVAFTAYFYFVMTQKFSKVLKGDYQKTKSMIVSISNDNINIKLAREIINDNNEKNDNIIMYYIEKNDIDFVKVLPHLIIIKLRKDGKIKLPRTKECLDMFEKSFVKSLKKYKVYN